MLKVRLWHAVPKDPALEVGVRPGWLFELKYDGYRLVAAAREGVPLLRYRRGQIVTDRGALTPSQSGPSRAKKLGVFLSVQDHLYIAGPAFRNYLGEPRASDIRKRRRP